METVEETIDVAVPVSTAYNQWTQFESFPNFMSGVESVAQLTDTANHWITKIGGVEREFDAEIVEQVPDQRIAWRSIDGKSHAGTVTFERLAEGSTRVKSDLRKFKEFIESRGAETGAWRGGVSDSGPTGTAATGQAGTGSVPESTDHRPGTGGPGTTGLDDLTPGRPV
ncbi:SRPBCC family protein [Arthrobacter crystallopoietes]|uniref:SRPBCC family protein n=1 Tax=Crystallibacter crystallopoietes TaxID=37928 RepID=UPI003D2098B8